MLLHYLLDLLSGSLTFIEFLKDLIFSVLAVLLACTVHEFCHSLVALLCGDKTSSEQGRLSLNPLAHLDLRGLIFLLLFGIGYAKPVNVRQSRLKNPKWGMIATAAAGPASNFLTALLLTFPFELARIQMYLQPNVIFWENLRLLLSIIIWYNIILGLFNLIPLPPLDGSKIIGELLPLKTRMKYYAVEQYSLYIWIGLIILLNRTDFLYNIGSGILSSFEQIWMPLAESIFFH